MEVLALMLLLWLVHCLFAGFLSLPLIIFGRKRAHLEGWESIAFLLPFSVWAVLMVISDSGKSLSNLVESQIIALAIPLAVAIRIGIGSFEGRRSYSALLILGLCNFAVGLYFFMPSLPE
jgi:hypothetical protein